MSAAWRAFVQQYDAQGQAALEGYARRHFDDLDATERARAAAMVIARADAGSAAEVRALPLLAVPDAERCAARLFAGHRAHDTLYVAICEAGWALTADPAYQHALFAVIDHGAAPARGAALTALCAMALTPMAFEFALAVLRREEDRAAAVALARAALRHRGVAVDAQADFMRELPRVRALSHVNLHDRGAAIGRFEAGGDPVG
jgi:hypothetical protein